MEDQNELSKTVVKVVQNLLMKKWVFTNKSKQMSAKLIWPTSPSLQNTLLMTKFGKAGKIGLSDFLFRTIRFWQFFEQEQGRS
jgi:hypothetical protein